MREIDRTAGLDVYYKGAWVIHSLRYLIGRDATLTLLRRFAYPTAEAEACGTGRACRFVATADFIRMAETVAGRDLGWFFRLYLDQPRLPKLSAEVQGGTLSLRWITPEGYPFPMPLEVEVDDRIERVPMPEGRAQLDGSRYAHARFDPQGWILKETSR
jgi:aminopeptidase N